jgi:diacylglycerol kinase family enzyme
LNHFAKDLQVPPELDAAVQTIAAGHAIRVNLREVRRFFERGAQG